MSAVAFDFLGVGWSLETDCLEVVHALSERLPPLMLAYDHTPVARRYVVTRKGRELSVRCGRGKDRSAAHAGEAGERIATDLCRLLARRAAGRTLVHAGAVAWRGRGIVLPGASGTGKSRLVEALVRRGAAYMSDDVAVLDGDGRVHPFARPLALRHESGMRRLAADRLGGAVGDRPVQTSAVVFAQHLAGAALEITELTPGACVLGLLRHTLEARQQSMRADPVLRRLSANVKAIRLVRDEAQEAADRLLTWLDELPDAAPPPPRLMLVTALFDVARREGNEERRQIAEYLRHGEFLVGLDADLVVFADSDLAPEIEARRAARGLAHRTRVVPLDLEQLPAAAQLGRIADARRRNPVHNANPHKDTPHYIAVTWSKFHLVERAIEMDPFASTHAAWIDFGISHVASTSGIHRLLAAPPERIRMLRMRDLLPSSVGPRSYYLSYLWGEIASGCVAGGRASWPRFTEIFADECRRMLTEGFAPSDEQLLPIVAESHPDLIDFAPGSDYPQVIDAVAGPPI